MSFLGKTMGEPDGKRHEGRGLIAGEPEHGHLVPCGNAFDLFLGHGPFIDRTDGLPSATSVRLVMTLQVFALKARSS